LTQSERHAAQFACFGKNKANPASVAVAAYKWSPPASRNILAWASATDTKLGITYEQFVKANFGGGRQWVTQAETLLRGVWMVSGPMLMPEDVKCLPEDIWQYGVVDRDGLAKLTLVGEIKTVSCT